MRYNVYFVATPNVLSGIWKRETSVLSFPTPGIREQRRKQKWILISSALQSAKYPLIIAVSAFKGSYCSVWLNSSRQIHVSRRDRHFASNTRSLAQYVKHIEFLSMSINRKRSVTVIQLYFHKTARITQLYTIVARKPVELARSPGY